MYRRLPDSLPADPVFPTTLTGLGFTINERDQLRRFDEPDQQYVYKITNNYRYNEMFRDRVYTALRTVIESRLDKAELLQRVYLPYMTSETPSLDKPSLPIYCSRNIRSTKRVVVIIQSQYDEWLIWSRASLTDRYGVVDGSVLGLAKAIAGCPDVGLIVTNPCHLLYSYDEGRAMSQTAWDLRAGRSYVHPPRVVVDSMNRIKDNETAQKHVAFVLDSLLSSSTMLAAQAKIDLVCINGGSEPLLHHLNTHWNKFAHRISAIAFANCSLASFEVDTPDLLEFLARRSRLWKTSHLDEGSVIKVPIKKDELKTDQTEFESPWEQALCPVISAGELDHDADTFTHVYHKMLSWLNEVASVEDYENPKLTPVVDERTLLANLAIGETEEGGWDVPDDSWD